jgi:hypothetical protein
LADVNWSDRCWLKPHLTVVTALFMWNSREMFQKLHYFVLVITGQVSYPSFMRRLRLIIVRERQVPGLTWMATTARTFPKQRCRLLLPSWYSKGDPENFGGFGLSSSMWGCYRGVGRDTSPLFESADPL